MEEVDSTRYVGRGGSLMPSLGVPFSPDLHMVTNPELSEPRCLRFLWRLHCGDLID